jgi:hypothetical protein
MLTRIMTWIAILGLLAALLLRPASGYQLALQFLVCGAAILVVLQSLDRGKAWLAVGFIVVAALFNPVVTPGMPRAMFLAVDTACLGMFLLSAYLSKPQPRLSIASITDRTPGSESL